MRDSKNRIILNDVKDEKKDYFIQDNNSDKSDSTTKKKLDRKFENYGKHIDEGRYSLQAGAFYSRRNAEKLKAQIEKLTDKPVVVFKQGDLYKVRVSGFKNKTNAKKYKRLFRTESIRTIIKENK